MDTLEEQLRAVAQGDIDALEGVYANLRTSVYSTALAIVQIPTVAEEVLQDTFVRVYERANQYRSGSTPKAWIVAIARNIAYDRLRSARREAAVEEVARVAKQARLERTGGESVESAVIARSSLLYLLGRLDSVDREIMMLRAVVGLPHRCIAEQLQIPEGTVRWKYRRGLRRLARLVEEEQDEP